MIGRTKVFDSGTSRRSSKKLINKISQFLDEKNSREI
jgi:hypothetical protein